MSLIYTKQIASDVFRVYCEQCGVPTDIVSGDEVMGLARGNYHVLCRECEGRNDDYPEIFKWEGESFWVIMGGELFNINWPASVREMERKWDCRVEGLVEFLGHVKPGDARSLACLVSTYLHKTAKIEASNG